MGKPNHRGAGTPRDRALWENLWLPPFQKKNAVTYWFVLSWPKTGKGKGFLGCTPKAQCTTNNHHHTWSSRLPKPEVTSPIASYDWYQNGEGLTGMALMSDILTIYGLSRSPPGTLSISWWIHPTFCITDRSEQFKPFQPFLGLELTRRKGDFLVRCFPALC